MRVVFLSTSVAAMLLMVLIVMPERSNATLVFIKDPHASAQLSRIMRDWRVEVNQPQSAKSTSHNWWPWGVGGFDFDDDGDIDLYLSHHARPGGKLIINQLKETAGLNFAVDLSHPYLPGADDRPWFFDINGDGWLDIIPWSDESKTPYYFNQDGQRFVVNRENKSLNPIAHPKDITDVNGDGYLDVDGGSKGTFIYQPDTQLFERVATAKPEVLARLDKKYHDIQAQVKRKKGGNNRFFKVNYFTHFINGFDTLGYSPDPIDLNNDGLTDLIIQGQGGYGGDYLGLYFVADKTGALTKANRQLQLPEQGVPIFYGDINGDQRADLFIVSRDTGGVYINQGTHFSKVNSDISAMLTTRGPYLIRAYPVDFDFDGDLDMVVLNPRGYRFEVHENDGSGLFTLVIAGKAWAANPIFIVDIDNDNRLDIIAGGASNEEVQVLLNRTEIKANWIGVYLRYAYPNPYAVDAEVRVYARTAKPNERILLASMAARWDGLPLWVGTANYTGIDIEVRFPDGEVRTYADLAAGHSYTLEYNGKAKLGKLSATLIKSIPNQSQANRSVTSLH